MSDVKQSEQQLHELMRKMTAYRQAIGLMNWDARTGALKRDQSKIRGSRIFIYRGI